MEQEWEVVFATSLLEKLDDDAKWSVEELKEVSAVAMVLGEEGPEVLHFFPALQSERAGAVVGWMDFGQRVYGFEMEVSRSAKQIRIRDIHRGQGPWWKW